MNRHLHKMVDQAWPEAAVLHQVAFSPAPWLAKAIFHHLTVGIMDHFQKMERLKKLERFRKFDRFRSLSVFEVCMHFGSHFL